jgi:hypothetical protein
MSTQSVINDKIAQATQLVKEVHELYLEDPSNLEMIGLEALLLAAVGARDDSEEEDWESSGEEEWNDSGCSDSGEEWDDSGC